MVEPTSGGGLARVGYGILAAVTGWWTLRLASGSADWCFMDLVNLAFHEAGHVFATPFGSTVHYLGGTIGQLLVPSLLIPYFLLRRLNPPAAAFCLWWLGENLVNVAVYMADARDLALPLVGGGDHDWNELLYRFDLLDQGSVETLSGLTRAGGVVLMLAGFAWVLFFALPGWVQAFADPLVCRWRELVERG